MKRDQTNDFFCVTERSPLGVTISAILCFCFSAFPVFAEDQQVRPLGLQLNLQVVGSYPHDSKAFTQGLVYEDGFLYEGTGQYGQSTLRKVDPTTGKVLKQILFPKRFFGEGIEIVGDRIYQLTWQEGYCFVFDKSTFKLIEQFRYPGEGWGLAYDGEQLILSDGTPTLRFMDPKTFKQKGNVQVTDRDPKTSKTIFVQNINELEFVRGELWANIWQSTRIARIDPKSGKILGWIDGSVFVPEELKSELSGPTWKRDRVLNGIAFDDEKNRFFLTGKNWPILYEIKIVEGE